MAVNHDRSPLKDPPLRTPGQSCEETRAKLIEDKLLLPGLWAAAFVSVALIETYGWFFEVPRLPLLYCVFAVASLALFVWRIYSVRPQLRQLRQAADGEKAVGQLLERLRPEGYEVIHDVRSSGFNLDHVLIGTTGVFAIETKTWTKPRHGNPTISFDDQGLLAGDQRPDRDPLVQARAASSWIRELLKESTGRDFPCVGVVVFPGWFVEGDAKKRNSVWVVNPKRLPEFLSTQPARIQPEDIKLASFHLSRYVRQLERETNR